MTLSRRQVALLDFIEFSITERGYAPVIREMFAATGLSSTATLTWHLQALEDHGYIERDRGARAIRLLRGSDGVRRELHLVRVDVDDPENNSDKGEIEYDEI